LSLLDEAREIGLEEWEEGGVGVEEESDWVVGWGKVWCKEVEKRGWDGSERGHLVDVRRSRDG
jgi:hypothetical protein